LFAFEHIGRKIGLSDGMHFNFRVYLPAKIMDGLRVNLILNKHTYLKRLQRWLSCDDHI
jgi:hypothetical protein